MEIGLAVVLFMAGSLLAAAATFVLVTCIEWFLDRKKKSDDSP